MTPFSAPRGWTSLSLGELTASTRPICYGVLKPGEFVRGGVPLIRVSDISENRFDGSQLVFIAPALDEEFRRSRLKGGEILISIQGTVGRVAICPPEYAGANISRTIAVVEPDSRADRGFLYWFLRFLGAHNRFHTVGTTRSSLNINTLRRVSVPLPTLPEQRRISEVLDRAEALRAKRRTALAQLDTLAQSILRDMFGDAVTNPKGWPQKHLGELISVGPQNGLYKPASDYGSGTPILRIDAFYDGVVTKLASLKRVRLSAEEQSLYALREGEIVINRVNSREYLGKSALIPGLSEATVFESNMMRFDVDREILNSGYLIQYLQTSLVRTHILRSAKDAVNQSSINQQDVRALPIIVPPMAMQVLFTQRLAARERLKAAHDASRTELEALFASLQHRAFRGEL